MAGSDQFTMLPFLLSLRDQAKVAILSGPYIGNILAAAMGIFSKVHSKANPGHGYVKEYNRSRSEFK
jgi:hypothetical protein